MPWVVADLRGSQVFARADAAGRFVSEGGRVEIRYRANDGRMYRAAERNLKVADPTVLPDDTCAEAEAVAKAKSGSSKSSRSKKSSKVAPLPDASGYDVTAWTDGACSGNPGPAGLGAVVIAGDQRIEIYEYLGRGTNNVAELTALLRALQEIDPAASALIHTDSKYSIGVVQKGWKAKANKELVAELRREMAAHPRAELVYVKGHAGIPLNERADELARLAVTSRSKARTLTPSD